MARANRWFTRGFLTAALVVAVAACAFPTQGTSAPDELAGTYFVNGVDPEGAEYSGHLEIIATDDPDVYDAQWIVTASVQTGTLRRHDDVVEGEWRTAADFADGSIELHGTIAYTVATDGSMTGERTVDGLSGVGTEEASPVE